MIKVLFRTNLGSTDAGRLGIENFRECLVGYEVCIPDTAAKVLEKSGVASIVEVVPPKPAQTAAKVELKSVPPREPETELAAEPAIVADSKDKKKK